jgi:sulfite reductase alpha subunit-like flavoprotein
MSGIHLPDDIAQAVAFESGRAAGLAAVVSEMKRAAPLEPARKAWLLGFLRGAMDAAEHSEWDDAANIVEWLKNHDAKEWLKNHDVDERSKHQEWLKDHGAAEDDGPEWSNDHAHIAWVPPLHDNAAQSRSRIDAAPKAVRVCAVETCGQGPESQHEWLSVAFDTDDRSVQFSPGSSLTLWPTNDPEEVRRLLRTLDVSAQLPVHTDYGSEPAWQMLLERVDLSTTTRDAIRLLADCARSDTEAKSLNALAEGPIDRARPLLSLLRRYPSSRPPLEALLQRLSPLKPNFVPIATSFLEQTKSLLVTAQAAAGESGWGQVSSVIRSKLRVGEWLSASVDEHQFPAMLNADDIEPVIVIVDGPGVALARAFAAERHERQAKGRTWVIVTGVGTTQFPYARTLAAWRRSGSITRFDVAPGFESSDTLRLLEEHEENLWRWFVDHSRLFVVAHRRSIRTAITEWFVGLLARRYRLQHDEATQRLHELSQHGQWVTVPQFAVAS